MKVDFWQLSRDPAERVVALIAQKVCGAGDRLLVVSSDPAQLAVIGKTLWETAPEAFLANGTSNEPGADRQPILLSGECRAVNGASHIIFADGQWRDTAEGFDRSFLLFDAATLDAARACWRGLDGRDGVERSFFRQDGGKWVKVA
ncbi:MAG: DNA polymerase III subunit chi [Pontixanthobacter sp.]